MDTMTVGTALDYNVNVTTGEVTEARNDNTFEQRTKELNAEEERQKQEEKLQKNSPYKHFAQFNIEYCKAWGLLAQQSPAALAVMMFFLEHIDNYNALVCSSSVIQEALNMSRPTVSRAVKLLREKGFVDVKKSGTTNVYLVNKELVWKSWGKNYRYAEFEAKIIISESEQEETADTKAKKINIVTVKK